MPTADEIRKRFNEMQLKKIFDGLVAVGTKPGREAAQQRGRDFEALVLDLLDVHGLLLRRSYHTADNGSEQIDGALQLAGRVALVEAKWVESGLAASELFAFLGKVEGKFVGTIGLFVSYVELSANFINALRAGRRQCILVVHGPDDLARLFDPTFPLREYLEECVHHVSIDNVPHWSAASFTSKRARTERADDADKKEDLRTLLKQLRNSGASASALVAAEKDPARLAANVRSLVDVFPRVLTVRPQEPLRAQILKYIDSATKVMEKKELDPDREFFQSVFPATILDPAYAPLHRAFSQRFPVVSQETRSIAESVLVAAWDEHFGSYEKENTLAEVTDPMWRHLTDESKRKLLGWFIHFVNSFRRRNFPQVQLARAMLADTTNETLRNEVFRDLVQKEFLGMLKADDSDLAWARRWVEHSFENTIGLLPADVVKTTLDGVQDDLTKTGKYRLGADLA